MSEELRPCPFCGNELPVHYIAMQNRYVQLISCPSCYATISCNKFLSDRDALATWNNRPIEDALNARIAELEHDLANKEIEYTDLWDDALAFQSRIAELESLVEQLIWVGNDLLVSNTNPVTITLFNGLVCNAKEREE